MQRTNSHNDKRMTGMNENNVLRITVAVAEWVARQTAEQEVGGLNPGIPPLLKHACGEGDWLLCWHYTLAKCVAPQVNLRKSIIMYASAKFE